MADSASDGHPGDAAPFALVPSIGRTRRFPSDAAGNEAINDPVPPPATFAKNAAHRSAGSNRSASPRGKWTIAAIFLLGGAVLAGLFLAPRARSPQAPADVPVGVPSRALRTVLFDLSTGPADASAAAAAIRAIAPDSDFVLLTGVSANDVPPIARALGMHASYHPQLFQRVTAETGPTGVCVLSKHPLYEGRSLRLRKRSAFGVAAVAVVDGRKFQVACVLNPPANGTDPASAADAARVASFLENPDGPPSIIGGSVGPPGSNGAGFGLMATGEWAIAETAGDPVRKWASILTKKRRQN